jgi:hypothetical protein
MYPDKSVDCFWWGTNKRFTSASISTMHVFLRSVSLDTTARRNLDVDAKLRRLRTPRY